MRNQQLWMKQRCYTENDVGSLAAITLDRVQIQMVIETDTRVWENNKLISRKRKNTRTNQKNDIRIRNLTHIVKEEI